MSNSDSRVENWRPKSPLYATAGRRAYRSVAFKTWSVNGAREPLYNCHSDYTLDRCVGSVSDSESVVLRTVPMDNNKRSAMFNRYYSNNGLTSVSLPSSVHNTPNHSPFKTSTVNTNGKLRKNHRSFVEKFGFIKRFWSKRHSDVPTTISDNEDALTVSDYGFDYGTCHSSPAKSTRISSRHSDVGYDLSVKPVEFANHCRLEEKVWKKRNSNAFDTSANHNHKFETAQTDTLCFPSWIDGVEYLKIQLNSLRQSDLKLFDELTKADICLTNLRNQLVLPPPAKSMKVLLTTPTALSDRKVS